MSKIPKTITVRRAAGVARKVQPAKAKQAPKVEEFNLWRCEACGLNDLSFEAVKDHLFGVHGIDVQKTPCDRQMIMHMDGRDFYSSTYKVTIAGVVLFNKQQSARDAEGMMWRGE